MLFLDYVLATQLGTQNSIKTGSQVCIIYQQQAATSADILYYTVFPRSSHLTTHLLQPCSATKT